MSPDELSCGSHRQRALQMINKHVNHFDKLQIKLCNSEYLIKEIATELN